MPDWLLDEAGLAIVRRAYARQMLGAGNLRNDRLEQVFATIRREDFLEAEPWRIVQWQPGPPLPANDPVYRAQVASKRNDQKLICPGPNAAPGRDRLGIGCRSRPPWEDARMVFNAISEWNQKRKLRQMLQDPRAARGFRSSAQLEKGIGADRATTERLLLAIGARKSSESDEWTLRATGSA